MRHWAQATPAHGLDEALQHALAALIELRKAQLGLGVSVLGQRAQQRGRLGVPPLVIRGLRTL